MANYFVEHNWQRDGEVAAQVTISDATAELPYNEKLRLESTVGALSDAGVMFATQQDAAAAAGLWELEGSNGTEYWVGFDNLYVITRYNRSVLYALATWQLGEAVMAQATAE